MQELSVVQSSLFSQAITIGGTMGDGVVEGNGGSVGLIDVSTSGGRGVLDGPIPGIMLASDGGSGLSVRGITVVGLSVTNATQCSVGLPVVPGGHRQEGLCPTV